MPTGAASFEAMGPPGGGQLFDLLADFFAAGLSSPLVALLTVA
jgi:hypothetical protein